MDAHTEEIREEESGENSERVPESEEERIQRMLAELFGAEEENYDFGAEEDWEGEVSAIDLRPEEVYSHLESEGILCPPVTVDRFIRSADEESRSSGVRYWGDWRTQEFQLKRDTACNDGVYRAGLEVGRGGFRTRESPSLPVDDRPEAVPLGVGGDPAIGRMAKQLESMNSLVVSLLGEISQVRSAFAEVQTDMKKVRQQAEEQHLSTKQQLKLIVGELELQRTQAAAQRLEMEQLQALLVEVTSQKKEIKRVIVAVEEQRGTVQEVGEKIETLRSSFAEERKQLLSAVQSYAEVAKNTLGQSSSLGVDTGTFTDVVKHLKAKIQTYTEESRASQTAALQEHERERTARQRKALNLRIAGLVEATEEDTKEAVTVFFRDHLKVINPGVESAMRVGRNENGPRTVLVRFSSVDHRASVLANRSALKGQRSATAAVWPIFGSSAGGK
ncbi:hypothetical protein R1sor_027199 [Riccia sorocarpa]|uniref:Uncharacterized protein n=1 Tax=Riccia sorocarpa TaxID=122646 RepID=A0ABD3GF79_9MARC